MTSIGSTSGIGATFFQPPVAGIMGSTGNGNTGGVGGTVVPPPVTCSCGGKGCPLCLGEKAIRPRDRDKKGSIQQTGSYTNVNNFAAAAAQENRTVTANINGNNEQVQLNNTGNKMTAPRAPDSIASSPSFANTAQSVAVAGGQPQTSSSEAARVNIKQVNNSQPASTNPASARADAGSNKADQTQSFPNTPKSVNINKTAQYIASVNKQADGDNRAVPMRAGGNNAELSLNPARQNVVSTQSSPVQQNVVQAQNNTSFAQGLFAGQDNKTVIAQTRPEIAAAVTQKQDSAAKNISSLPDNVKSETVQTARGSVSESATQVNTARTAVTSNSTTTGSVVSASASSGSSAVASASAQSSGVAAANSANSAAIGGGMSAQILNVINSPVLNNAVNAAAFLASTGNAGQPSGGVAMGNNTGVLGMSKPVQVNVALSTEKALFAGKSGGAVFGDIGAKETKAQSQPIISFAELSRIAHERDVQKENLGKLINMLFGKIIQKEEQDEDLEGMYGAWRDYLERQREQKDRREQEERRKKKQKWDAELQEQELEAVAVV